MSPATIVGASTPFDTVILRPYTGMPQTGDGARVYLKTSEGLGHGQFNFGANNRVIWSQCLYKQELNVFNDFLKITLTTSRCEYTDRRGRNLRYVISPDITCV
jgi:hypothetical protein